MVFTSKSTIHFVRQQFRAQQQKKHQLGGACFRFLSDVSKDSLAKTTTSISTNKSSSSCSSKGAATATATAAVIDSRRLYEYLNLSTFSNSELETVFQKIQNDNIHNVDNDTVSGSKKSVPSATATIVSPEDGNFVSIEQLETFIHARVLELEKENGYINKNDEAMTESERQEFIKSEVDRCWAFFQNNNDNNNNNNNNNNNSQISKDVFVSTLHETASALDVRRVLPLTMSMVLVGSSVGVVTPVMPFVVQNLGLTAGEYGLVVSAFALAKMTGNIPSAILVERHGRKPYLVYSMAIISLGVGGIGFAGSFEELYLCRLFTGLGVAGLSTAATMTVTDISTPLNRASTFAPIMSAFAAGTALGPALGGILCDQVGVNPTFYLVGASYIGLAAVNSILLDETKSKPTSFPWQVEQSEQDSKVSIKESFQTAVGQWIPLLSTPEIRNVCIMNGFYWTALAGSQMTLLPLILTNPEGLAMSATNVGQIYMGMSTVQVLGNPILAKIVDRVGKVSGIIAGCSFISVSMAALPMCNDLYQMAGVLGCWATGSTLLSTAPISYVSDKVDDTNRAQAIALLRTTGDVGFLIGASTMGALADYSGSLETAMQSSSSVLLAATGWFAARNFLNSQLAKDQKV